MCSVVSSFDALCKPIYGALDGGPQRHLSILRNDHVPCHYFCNVCVDLKNVACQNLRNTLCHVVYFILLSLSSMSHVDFKKWPCRCVEFKGQDTYTIYVTVGAWIDISSDIHTFYTHLCSP